MRTRALLLIMATLFFTSSATAQVAGILMPPNEMLKSAQNSKFDDVIRLVRTGMDPSQQDILGKNALMLILEAGHPDIAISFMNELKASLKPNAPGSEPWREIPDGWVFAAARKNQALGSADSQGRTPLMIAAANGYTEVVRMLVKEDASLDARNSEGLTAAMIAEKAGHPEIVAILTR
jgi:ankyrin repeat protein